jgi:DNA-binding beta-propeller fold protein YncE
MIFPQAERHHPLLRRIAYFVGAAVIAAGVMLSFAGSPTRSAGTSVFQTPTGIRQISLATNDIIYDPARNTIYASVPNSNNVVRINPSTGVIGPAVTNGATPGRLALSGDGQFLYVGINGANSIRRFDLQSSTTANEFTLGPGSFGNLLRAEEIEVMPGQPLSVAVALEENGSHQGVAVFDNGVPRPNRTSQTIPNDIIEFAGDAATLYGYNTSNTESGIHRLAVDANGLSLVSTLRDVMKSGRDLRFDSGRLFGSSGVVIDPQGPSITGTFQLPGIGYAVAPDVANNRVYFISGADTDTFLKLWAYDLQTFLPVGNVTLTGLTGRPSRLIRCGPGGLAVRTDENQVFLIQLSAIQPLSPTPLPSPTFGANSVMKLQLATNDLAFDASTQKVYASVPGNVTGIGNSIVAIDPLTGNSAAPVFIGSGPNKLAVSGDHQYLYAGLDGAASVRRLDLPSQSPGPQFSLGFSSFAGHLSAGDIEVQPGNSSVVAISLRNKGFSSNFEGVAIYDNGVKRPNAINQNLRSQAIEFGSPSVLYGAGGISEAFKFSVDGSGVSLVKTNRNILIAAGDFALENGVMYAFNGQAYDPEAETVLGSFATSGLVVSDAAASRVYYLSWNQLSPEVDIFAFDSSTFLPVSFLTIQGISGTPGSFIRWGADGLAFRTTGNQVFFFHTSAMQAYPTLAPEFSTRGDGLKELSLFANDLVYNPADQMFYATVPSFAGSIGNSIATINPTKGVVGQPVFVGSDPYKLGLSDTGNVLYTSLLGAPRVRKFDVTTKTPGAQFGLGSDFIDGPFYGESVAVVPGNPDQVAVGTYLLPILGCCQIVLANNGVIQPNVTGGDSMVFSGSHLYTYSNSTSEFGLRKVAVTSDGFSQVDFMTNIVNGFSQQIAAANGRIYGSDGAVADANSLTLVGKFARTDAGVWVAPDPANNRVYFLGLTDNVADALNVTAYDTKTFLQVGSVTLRNVRNSDAPMVFLRYGPDGLAFLTSGGKIFFFSTSLLAPLAPTPAPTPIQVTPEIKRLSLSTGGLVYNRQDGLIYASVPSRMDGFGPPLSFGNSIVPINPLTATMGQPVPVGSEPKRLVITDNGQHIYVALDGEGAVGRFDVLPKTLGLRFSLGNDVPFKGPRYVEDMQLEPGSTTTLAISRMHKNGTPRHVGVAIYDSGVQRPTTTSTEFPTYFDNNNVIEYSNSPATIYGYNLESTVQNFHKLGVNASGVQLLSTLETPFSVADMAFDKGLLYLTNGQVFNPDSSTVVGAYSGLGFGNQLIIPESATDTIFFLEDNFSGVATIRVYKQSTFTLIGAMTVPGIKGRPGSFIRWGTNGLAFRTSSNSTNEGNQLFIIQLPPALTPAPTPTPTPTPGPPQLLIDAAGPAADQAAALDAALFVRDPFPVVNPLNWVNPANDRNTRVVVFVRNLQLAQGEIASSVVVNLVDANNQNHDVPAEDVRQTPNTDFTQVIFRLPNNLAPGVCTVKVKAHAQTSNAGTFRIRI